MSADNKRRAAQDREENDERVNGKLRPHRMSSTQGLHASRATKRAQTNSGANQFRSPLANFVQMPCLHEARLSDRVLHPRDGP